MPIYEYLCEKCGSHIEVIQKISDAPLKRCAKCRGKLEKTVSRTSFQLKGSGWYVTDYSRKDASGGKSASAGAEKTEKKSEKKAEPVSSSATTSGDSD
jgi:putative FmdB family regulatory protein